MEAQVKYNPFPLGQIPNELQRQEPNIIKEMGYEWSDPRDIVTLFENKVAEFYGSKYAVSVDCCTHAIELSFRYFLQKGDLSLDSQITIPDNTYLSAYLVLKKIGFKNVYLHKNLEWRGFYLYKGSNVVDSAVMWDKDMYIEGCLQCLSFQIKKHIPIGRGGMVLTDDKDASDWIRLASYDGRDLKTTYDDKDHVKIPIGYHYYMTPEDAARGIILMDKNKNFGISAGNENYPSITKMLNL